VLCRLTFLESEERTPIIDGPLTRVHLFKRRLPMMHRRGWDGPKASSQVPYAWFVFERGHTGPALLDRIDWKNAGRGERGQSTCVRARATESPAHGQCVGLTLERLSQDAPALRARRVLLASRA
jgi:hypothetical protein